MESLFFIRKDILCHLLVEYNFLQMLAATTNQDEGPILDDSEGPILDDWFEHFDRYGVNDTRNVGFQNLNRSWFVSIDFGLCIAPKKKVERCDITRSRRPTHRYKT